MASFNKFNAFVADLANKVHNLGSDTLKFMLSNTLPTATNAVKADITEITAGNGYSAGGTTSAQVSSTQTAGLYKLILTTIVYTASGGSIGPLRYVVLYNSTPVAGPLIGWYDYGSSITLLATETLTVTVDGTNGTLQIQ